MQNFLFIMEFDSANCGNPNYKSEYKRWKENASITTTKKIMYLK